MDPKILFLTQPTRTTSPTACCTACGSCSGRRSWTTRRSSPCTRASRPSAAESSTGAASRSIARSRTSPSIATARWSVRSRRWVRPGRVRGHLEQLRRASSRSRLRSARPRWRCWTAPIGRSRIRMPECGGASVPGGCCRAHTTARSTSSASSPRARDGSAPTCCCRRRWRSTCPRSAGCARPPSRFRPRRSSPRPPRRQAEPAGHARRRPRSRRAVGAPTSYAFEDEHAYYEDLRRARYGITVKRAGWDCLRHYELAANGCVPCFRALRRQAAALRPPRAGREQLRRIRQLRRADGAPGVRSTSRAIGPCSREPWAGPRTNSTVIRAPEFLAACGLPGPRIAPAHRDGRERRMSALEGEGAAERGAVRDRPSTGTSWPRARPAGASCAGAGSASSPTPSACSSG